MGLLIFQAIVILAILTLLAYLAYDDRRNTRQREEEDKVQALEQEKAKEKS